jgi:DNA end-binding protein Ku
MVAFASGEKTPSGADGDPAFTAFRRVLGRLRRRPHLLLVAKERPIWTGAISFGLVSIPVRLHTATSSHDFAFHQFEEKTGQRIHYKRVAERSGHEVPYDKIVKGYEVRKGKIVLVEPEELAALEPRKQRTIDIEEFVDLNEIDPIHFDATYYLAPDANQAGRKSYEILRRAMDESGKVAVGRFVMRTKEYLTTIRPLGPGLALETMFWADEIRSQRDLLEGSRVSVTPREVALAHQLIDSLSGSFDAKKFKDKYRDRVMDLIRKKSRGEEIDTTPPAEEKGEVVDLMEALKRSLAASKKGGGKKKAAAGHRRRAA